MPSPKKKSTAKTTSTGHPALATARHFNKWMAFVIAAFSVAAGYLIFLAIHASGGYDTPVTLTVVNVNGGVLPAGTVVWLKSAATPPCIPPAGTADAGGHINFVCIQYDTFSISSITPPPGYSVYSGSPFRVGSTFFAIPGGQPPPIELTTTPPPAPLSFTISPASNTTVTTNSLRVTGSLTGGHPGAISVKVNGVAAVVSGNSYAVTVALGSGLNTITAIATDSQGSSASKLITINSTYKAPSTGGGSSGGTTPSSGSSGSSSGTATSSGSSSKSSGSKTSTGTTSGSSGSSGAASGGAASTTGGTTDNTTGGDTTTPAEDAVSSGDAANVLNATSSSVTSDDGLVTVTFPAGTFNVDATCVITKDTSSVPVKSAQLLGPYAVSCADTNNDSLTAINHPLTASIELPGTQSYRAYVQNGSKWATAKATTKNKVMSLTLAKLTAFAATPGTSWAPALLILGAIALLLFGSGGGLYFLIHRRNQQTEYDNYIHRRFIEGDTSATTTAEPPAPTTIVPPTTPPPPPPAPPVPPVTPPSAG